MEKLSSPDHPIQQNQLQIEETIRDLLSLLGEDVDRNGLLRTPNRVARMFSELLRGYSKDLKAVINGAIYEVDSDHPMVLIDSIAYQSMCEHHLLPFTGKAHIAYLPTGRIIGLSKIPRIVDMFALRLQVQERMTNEIAAAIDEALKPRGLAIVVTGEHSCASLRGVRKHGVNMKTSVFRGELQSRELKDEFFKMISIK